MADQIDKFAREFRTLAAYCRERLGTGIRVQVDCANCGETLEIRREQLSRDIIEKIEEMEKMVDRFVADVAADSMQTRAAIRGLKEGL